MICFFSHCGCVYDEKQTNNPKHQTEKSPPIDAVINAGCLPYLVQCLGKDDNQKLQFEAAWALTNVASGESRHTNELVKCGAVQPLLRLLGSPSWEIREQAVWALGNVAATARRCATTC